MSGWPAHARAVQEEVNRRPSRWARLARRLPRRLPPGVYVFVYHSIVDRGEHDPWEVAYARVLTWLDDFERHLQLLTERMAPVTLEEAERTLAAGEPDAPAFAITFDDGYANLARGAAEACARFGVRPTVFVSGDFAAGRRVYHRVLLSLLDAAGRGRDVARSLGADAARGDLLTLAKDEHEAEAVERAVLDVWDGELPRAHLRYDELRDLASRGWTVGNHTLSHAILTALEPDELDRQVTENQRELEREGLRPLRWLAYPNSRADAGVRSWLEHNRDFRGLFADGGVNTVPTRTEWLRIPVGMQGAPQLARYALANAEATRRALSR